MFMMLGRLHAFETIPEIGGYSFLSVDWWGLLWEESAAAGL